MAYRKWHLKLLSNIGGAIIYRPHQNLFFLRLQSTEIPLMLGMTFQFQVPSPVHKHKTDMRVHYALLHIREDLFWAVFYPPHNKWRRRYVYVIAPTRTESPRKLWAMPVTLWWGREKCDTKKYDNPRKHNTTTCVYTYRYHMDLYHMDLCRT